METVPERCYNIDQVITWLQYLFAILVAILDAKMEIFVQKLIVMKNMQNGKNVNVFWKINWSKIPVNINWYFKN